MREEEGHPADSVGEGGPEVSGGGHCRVRLVLKERIGEVDKLVRDSGAKAK